MIVADRNALKANIIQGISNNLQMLVDLYSTNLNSIGVQSSVLASLMYASLASTSLNDGRLNEDAPWLSGFYYSLSVLSLTASLLCVILCTIAAVYGPWLALTGESNTIIILAITEMKRTQQFVFHLLSFALLTFLMTIMAYVHSNFQVGIATMITLMLICTVFTIAGLGYRSAKRIRFKGQKYLDELFKLMEGENDPNSPISGRPQYPPQQFEGPIWKRKEAHKGGNFSMVYVVLKRGCLEIYSNKESYEQGENMKEKIKLVNLRLTQKLNEFHFEYNSFSLTPSKFTLDLSLLFAIVPREDHEVVSSVQVVEFQAVSVDSKREWIKNLQLVDAFYDENRGNAITALLSNRD